MNSEKFPYKIFLVYVIFYAGQSIYNTYLNLFLTDIGFTLTSIGVLSSISTLLLIFIQPLFGILSDKAKSKNTIIGVLVLISGILAMIFYIFTNKPIIALSVIVFTVFFSPTFSLQDNYTLELLEDSKWDFGQIRLGGTIGYAVTALILGFFIKDDYSQVFCVMSLLMGITAILYFAMPKIKGHRQKHQKVKYSDLIKNKALICIVGFNILYSMGVSFYFQFYPIYFRDELGASAAMVGALSFISAMSEIPFFMFAYKIEKKFGVEKVMLFAGIATAIRWVLLSFVTNPFLALAVNMLHGCGYVGFSYCLIKYISKVVPKHMRATAQTFNAVISIVFSKIIFGALAGAAGDMFGIQNVLLISCGLTVVGIILFKLTFKKAEASTIIEQ